MEHGYVLKEDVANEVRKKFKNSYFVDLIGVSGTYTSLILHRKIKVTKPKAYCFAKAIGSEYEINDLFDFV